MHWWLSSKTAHVVTATAAFAIPLAAVFGMLLHARGLLTLRNGALLLAITISCGLICAIGTWEVWFKKKRL